MARAASRSVSCGVTVCIPAGAPRAADARGAERLDRPAARRVPLRRPAGLRAGALRRAVFFAVFFFAMGVLPRMAFPKPRRGRAVNGTLRSVDWSLPGRRIAAGDGPLPLRLPSGTPRE